ncbi:MAG: transglycosylase domain-containing protein [Pseudomonadota bacterium]
MPLILTRIFDALGRGARVGGRALRAHPWRTALALPLLPVLYVLLMIPFTPSVADIRGARDEKPAVLLSTDGKVLAEFRRSNREWVKLADISPYVTAALIATEDRRFYEHHGIDYRRTVGAVLNTLRGDRQGGSTITQQLARNLYPEQIGRSVSLNRKVKEAITAFKIEHAYSKDEILETYLNTVPFLYDAYGIEMAARTYFDSSAAALGPLESATLIGMLKGTSYYNPVTNPERAQQRRNLVLAQMVRAGKLPQARLEALQQRPLKVDFERQTEVVGVAPHLARQLRRWLIDWADRHDYDIYTDGLRVVTTIDSRLQEAANRAVERQAEPLQRAANAMWGPRTFNAGKPQVQAMLRETKAYKDARQQGLEDLEALKQVVSDTQAMQALREDKTRLQAGFLALDPRNGQVRAWVGSRDYADDQFDHVVQARRQPGSTFKPFVYGTAFAQGISPDETLVDQPMDIPLGGGQVWRPMDDDTPSMAPMSLRDGLAYSKNIITAQLMQRVGPAAVANLARALGVRQSKLDEVPSLALGTSPVTLREMVAAYGSIANGGSYIEPVLVTRVEDRNGQVLEEFAPVPPAPAMDHAAAQTLLDVMRGVVDRGTGAAIRSRWGIKGDVAGKTGTTQDNTDGWFILMQPELVAGAWVGFNDNRVTMAQSWGQGARSALPMVGDFMQAALKAKLVSADAVFDAPRLAPVLQSPQDASAFPGDPSATVQPSGPPSFENGGVAPPGSQGGPGSGAPQGPPGGGGFPYAPAVYPAEGVTPIPGVVVQAAQPQPQVVTVPQTATASSGGPSDAPALVRVSPAEIAARLAQPWPPQRAAPAQ